MPGEITPIKGYTTNKQITPIKGYTTGKKYLKEVEKNEKSDKV